MIVSHRTLVILRTIEQYDIEKRRVPIVVTSHHSFPFAYDASFARERVTTLRSERRCVNSPTLNPTGQTTSGHRWKRLERAPIMESG